MYDSSVPLFIPETEVDRYSQTMFRTRFESRMHRKGKPVIKFLISGDIDDVGSVVRGLREHLPVIIMLGSGGASDVIASAIHALRQKLTQHDESTNNPSTPERIMHCFSCPV